MTGYIETIKVFSGGSCGDPKQLQRPRQSWLDSLSLETQAFGLGPDHRYGVLGSAQHSLWSYAMFRGEQTQSFFKGLPVSPRDQLACITANELSVLYAVTPLLQLLCRQAVRLGVQAHCVEKIIAGGSAWPVQLTELCRATFPKAQIICFYGAAELGYVAHSGPSEPLRPFPGVQLRTDARAELWVRSPLTISPKKWIASGDCIVWASTDGDVNPELGFYVRGRVDRVINQSGVKIQPEPIEEQLKFAMACSEIALLGLPDSLRGQRLALFLGPQLASRHGELWGAIRRMPDPLCTLLQGAKALELKTWPLQSNGKLSLNALLKESLRGTVIPRGLRSFA